MRPRIELVLARLGVAAKLEPPHSRTHRKGRADAKAKGVKFGRKPKLTAHQQREARERIEGGETLVQAAPTCGNPGNCPFTEMC